MESTLLLPQTVAHSFSNQWVSVKSYFSAQTRLVQCQYARTGSNVLMNWRRLTSRFQQRIKNRRNNDKRRLNLRLTEFEDRFEALVDLLCVTAHEGARSDRQRHYAAERNWMRRNYPRVRKFIKPYWQESEGRNEDPFSPLYVPKRIEEVINCELCIDRITASRHALQECMDALK